MDMGLDADMDTDTDTDMDTNINTEVEAREWGMGEQQWSKGKMKQRRKPLSSITWQ
jgi:muconolactone delta-isomerase